jgi:hypothetical protein
VQVRKKLNSRRAAFIAGEKPQALGVSYVLAAPQVATGKHLPRWVWKAVWATILVETALLILKLALLRFGVDI